MIVAFVPDLMDRSKVASAGDVAFVSRAEDLPRTGADILVVDLSRDGVLDVLPTLAAGRVIGFASHVDRDVMDAARAAGCTEVLARSVFFARLGELLS